MSSPFSLRSHLMSKGVNDETSLRQHTAFVQVLLRSNPSLDLRRYNPRRPTEGMCYNAG